MMMAESGKKAPPRVMRRSFTRPTVGKGRGSDPNSAEHATERFVGMQLLGRYLRDCRVNAGLTQLEVAKAVGMTDSAVAHLERGDRPLPPSRLKDFAAVCNVDLKDFSSVYLKYTNPWVYAAQNGIDSPELKELLKELSDVVKPVRGKKPDRD